MGLQRIYAQQHVDGGWGWWQNDDSRVAVSSYVVFAGEGQAGRLHRRSDRAGSWRALPDRKPQGAEGSGSPCSSMGRRSPSTCWPRPGRWSRTWPARWYEARERVEHLRQSIPGAGVQPDQRQSRRGRHQDAAGRHQRAGDHQRYFDALGRGICRLLEHEHRHPHDFHRARHARQARSRGEPGPQHRALADGRGKGGPLGDHPGERLGHHGADRLDGGHGRARGELRLARDAERRRRWARAP